MKEARGKARGPAPESLVACAELLLLEGVQGKALVGPRWQQTEGRRARPVGQGPGLEGVEQRGREKVDFAATLVGRGCSHEASVT